MPSPHLTSDFRSEVEIRHGTCVVEIKEDLCNGICRVFVWEPTNCSERLFHQLNVSIIHSVWLLCRDGVHVEITMFD